MYPKCVIIFVVLLFSTYTYCQDEDLLTAEPDVLGTDETTTTPSVVDESTTGDTVNIPAIVPEDEIGTTPLIDESETTTDIVSDTTATSADPDASPTTVSDAEETPAPAPFEPDGFDPFAGSEDTTLTVTTTTDPDVTATDTTVNAENTTDPGLIVVPPLGDAGEGDTPVPEDITSTTSETTTTTTTTTSSPEAAVAPVVPVQPSAPISEQRPISLSPPGLATAATAKGERKNIESEGWWRKFGLLVAGVILLLAIVIGYIYACCCIKDGPAARRFSRIDMEHGTSDTVPIVKPIDSLTKSNKYVDEMITNASYHYQETRRETSTTAKKADGPGTPNNSIIAPGEVTALENQNTRYANKPGKPAAISIPIGTPLNSPTAPVSAPATHFKYSSIPRSNDKSFVHVALTQWDRRLDIPSGPITSRDIINASRVNNAVVTVAAAGSTPVKPIDIERPERPVLRGATLPHPGTPPIRSPTYRTTLLLTPVHNQDPDAPSLPAGEEMPYRQYIELIKGGNSDFAQYSPEYNRDLAELERRNTESQL